VYREILNTDSICLADPERSAIGSDDSGRFRLTRPAREHAGVRCAVGSRGVSNRCDFFATCAQTLLYGRGSVSALIPYRRLYTINRRDRQGAVSRVRRRARPYHSTRSSASQKKKLTHITDSSTPNPCDVIDAAFQNPSHSVRFARCFSRTRSKNLHGGHPVRSALHESGSSRTAASRPAAANRGR